MMDLVQACLSRGLLVETPILGFGLYSVAFVGVYAMNFPHMDPDGYMCSRDGVPEDAAGGHQAARKALEMIGQMRSRLPMATNWFRTIHRVHRYYEKIINDYRINTQALRESSSSATNGTLKVQKNLSLREGGVGNGVESYKLLEKTLKEFGSIEDEDVDILNGDRDRRGARMSFNSSTAGEPVPKLESRPSENWTAINSIVNIDSGPESRPPAPTGHPSRSQSYSTYPGQDQQSHGPHLQRRPYAIPLDPPSLTASATATAPTPTPSLSLSSASPYQRAEFSPSTLQTPQLPQQQQQQQQQQQVPTHLVYSTPPPSSQQQQQQPPTYPPHLLSQPPHLPSYPIHPPLVYDHSALPPTPHHPPPPNNNNNRHWNQEMQDLWLNSLRKPLGGDDVAAFVDGRSCEEWAQFNAPHMVGGYGAQGAGAEGWLSEVWGGGWGGGG